HRLASHRWVSRTRSFIPELDRDVIVKPGQAYLYDLETNPDFRRLGIEALVRQHTYKALQGSYGVREIFVYIRADNYASLRAAKKYLTPMCRVWFLRFRGKAYMLTQQPNRMPELKQPARDHDHAAFLARPSSSAR